MSVPKVAVITGGGSGIGRALAVRLAKDGWKLVLADLTDAGMKESIACIMSAAPTAHVIPVICNVTKYEEIKRAIDAAVSTFGGLGLMVNNAGIAENMGTFAEPSTEPTSYARIVDVDLNGVIYGTDLAIREFRRAKSGGIVLNTASVAGTMVVPAGPIYAAAKAGVIHFSRCLGYLQSENIRVNAVAPHFVDTPMVQVTGRENIQQISGLLGDLLRPDDIVEAMMELINDETKAGKCLGVVIGRGRAYWPRSKM
eukprot:GILK01002771.1.p1 GENE.GILK01002771.1~~GILK01002771.1.p1  ORF type:complete len:255 (+),score=22.23 GILK01002771.1:46-810(+)